MKTVFRKNSIHLLQYSRKKFLAVSCIISFLLFFLNMLVVLQYNAEQLSDSVEAKLGLYFYIHEAPAMTGDIIEQRRELFQQSLIGHGLQVKYISKESGLEQLSKRLPNIFKSFESYGIKNPLPSTLYVSFSNQEQYEFLKSTISGYQDILEIGESVEFGSSFADQQYRVLQVISMIQMIRIAIIVLIVILLLIILSFLYFSMQVVFLQFHKQIELEKLLGASYSQIMIPFLVVLGCTLGLSFVLVIGYSVVSISFINSYMLRVMYQTIFESFLPSWNILLSYQVLQIFCLSCLSALWIWLSLYRMIQRV